MIEPSRRSLITGLISFAVCAPAIVRAGSLMPVKVMQPLGGGYLDRMAVIYGGVRQPEESDAALRLRFATMIRATAGLGHRFDPITAFGWND